MLGTSNPLKHFGKALELKTAETPAQQLIFAYFYRAVCATSRGYEPELAIEDFKSCLALFEAVDLFEHAIASYYLMEVYCLAGQWSTAKSIGEAVQKHFKSSMPSPQLKIFPHDSYTNKDFFASFWKLCLSIARETHDSAHSLLALNKLASDSRASEQEKQQYLNEIIRVSSKLKEQEHSTIISQKPSSEALSKHNRFASDLPHSSKSGNSTTNLSLSKAPLQSKAALQSHAEAAGSNSGGLPSSKLSSHKIKSQSNFIKFVPTVHTDNKKKKIIAAAHPQTAASQFQSQSDLQPVQAPATPKKLQLTPSKADAKSNSNSGNKSHHKKSPSMHALSSSKKTSSNHQSSEGLPGFKSPEQAKTPAYRASPSQPAITAGRPFESPVAAQENVFTKRASPSIVDSSSPKQLQALGSARHSQSSSKLRPSARKSLGGESSRELRNQDVERITVVESPQKTEPQDPADSKVEEDPDELIESIDLFLLKINSMLEQSRLDESESFLGKFISVIQESDLTLDQIPRQVYFKKYLEASLLIKRKNLTKAEQVLREVIALFKSLKIEHAQVPVYLVYQSLATVLREKSELRQGLKVCTEYLVDHHERSGVGTLKLLKLFFKIIESQNVWDCSRLSAPDLQSTTEMHLWILEQLAAISRLAYTNVKIPGDLFADKRLETLTLVSLSYLLRDMPDYAKECIDEFAKALTSIEGDRLYLVKEMVESLITGCQADLLCHFVTLIDAKQPEWPSEDKYYYFATSLLRVAENLVREENLLQGLAASELALRYLSKVRVVDFSLPDQAKCNSMHCSILLTVALCRLETSTPPSPDKLLKQV